MRKDGFYWVRNQGTWRVAEWYEGFWYDTVSSNPHADNIYDEIDERCIIRPETTESENHIRQLLAYIDPFSGAERSVEHNDPSLPNLDHYHDGCLCNDIDCYEGSLNKSLTDAWKQLHRVK